MNGEGPQLNGSNIPNGISSIKPPPPPEHSTRPGGNSIRQTSDGDDLKTQVNGAGAHLANGGVSQNGNHEYAPDEPLQLVEQTNYLPVANLVHRTTQRCWNGLYDLVDHLSRIEVPEQPSDTSRGLPYAVSAPNQTKANLEKKDRILIFANDQKTTFIKLLVLLQWSKNVQDVGKTISLNYWLNQQRLHFNHNCFEFYALKQEATNWQLPNPDIRTAGEILALGKLPSLSNLGYKPIVPLSKRQILATLRRLNRILATRLTTEDEIPQQMCNFVVHDGRVTFTVAEEFEVDLSVSEDKSSSPFRLVDLRFLFSPRPYLSDALRASLERLTNFEIDKGGLKGCYDFLHELVLTNKLAEMHQQASSLESNQWAGHLKVEMVRRHLIVQYWTEKPIAKSWIEIGINSGRRATVSGISSASSLKVRWFREGTRMDDFHLELDDTKISFQTILLQLIAQHLTHLLDAIYDKLLLSNMYSSGEREVEVSGSIRPEDCYLKVEVMKDSQIRASINAVTGLTTISSASERTSRLQFELNRSKNIVEDFVPRFLNFRCAVVETQILQSINGTSWQNLHILKPPIGDIRAAFGATTTRASFFRHPIWSKDYLFVIAYRSTGDSILLLQLPDTRSMNLSEARALHSQDIRFDNELSAEFFESFVRYASGVIVLDSLARELESMSRKHGPLQIPAFAAGYELPAVPVISSHDSANKSSPRLISDTAVVRFQRIDELRKLAEVDVQLKCYAPEAVLQQLIASDPAKRFNFDPKSGQISLQMLLKVGQPNAHAIVQNVETLGNIVAAVQFIKELSYVRLTSLTMETMTAAYTLNGRPELSLQVFFPSSTQSPRVVFKPESTNPHTCLAAVLSRQLSDPGASFAAHLRDMVASISLIDPLLLILSELRDKGNQEATGSSQKNKLKLHLLVRQPTMVALSYYLNTSGGDDSASGGKNSPLLARFEIMPLNHQKPTFALRPAIEEQKSVKRLSFCSDGVRALVREQIFAIPPNEEPQQAWMRLDVAAAFLVHQARPLLEKLHSIMLQCAENPPAAVPAANATNLGLSQNKNQAPSQAPAQPQQQPPQQSQPVGKAATSQAKANAKSAPNGQRQVPNGAGNAQRARPNQARPPANMQGKEVITLD
jgi:mediator of RNA polymerase II transcription subunit 14